MISSQVDRVSEGRGNSLQQGAGNHAETRGKIVLPDVINFNSSFPNERYTSVSLVAKDIM